MKKLSVIEVRFLPYLEAAALLRRYGIPLAPAHLVQSPSEALAAAAALGYPVALKAISAEATHKSDVGLLHLNLDDDEALLAAAAELLPLGRALSMEGLLVQAMVPPGVEMIAGVTHDDQFGPVLALGSGGILVELLEDVVLRLPPLRAAQARRMVEATRSWPLLQGFRSQPPADVPALVELLVNLSRLALAEGERLVSLDLNPVIVLAPGQGVQIVDLRLAVKDTMDQEVKPNVSS